MIKAFAALAILAVSGASVAAIPSFAPKAAANEKPALTKSDRLAIQSPAQPCLEQTWPNLTTACLHSAGSDATIAEARPVGAPR